MERENIIQHLSQLLRSGTMTQVKKDLVELHPAEIANLLESLPIPKRRIAWELLDPNIKGEVLVHTNEETRTNLIEMTNDHDLLLATEGLEADDLADLLDDLPNKVREQALAGMARQDRTRIEQIMTFAEETAGSLMNTDTVTIQSHVSLEMVLHYLRMRKKIPEHTDRLIVVDYQHRYIGMLSLRKLITEPPETRVIHVMRKDIHPVLTTEPASKVAKLFEDHDLVSIAVVDEENHLLGRITVDDVVDVIRDEAQKERFGFAGMSGEEDLFAPIFASAQKRTLWLGINLVTAFLAAWFINLFQDTLKEVIALAVLVPVVASMGGIAGYQTMTIIVRGLATGRVVKDNSPLLVGREISIGLLNGLFWAIIVATATIIWFGDFDMGWIIGSAMIATLLCAAGAGVLIPVLLKKLSIDPALAGGVMLTTLTDIIGIITFLGLATLFLI